MREATRDDAGAIEELEIQLFPDNCLGAKLIECELEWGTGWVVEHQGVTVAYLLARVEGDMVDIMRVGVLPKHRRRGHAIDLINRALEQAPDAMLTVRKNNLNALRLYRRLGFGIVGETGFGSWVMRYATSGATLPSCHSRDT